MDGTQEINSMPGDSPKTTRNSHHVAKDKTQQTPAKEDNKQLASVALDAGLLLNRPGAPLSDLEIRLLEVEQRLKTEKETREKERIWHETATSDLQAKLRDMKQRLEMEQNRHTKTRSDLIEKHEDAKHQRQLALDAVGELNRFMRGNQLPNQLTDHEIIQKVNMLRVSIRDFAILHFGGSIDQLRINQVSLESLNEFLRIPHGCLEKYISTSSMRVNTIRAFFWAYLHQKVFDRFPWAWRDAGPAFIHIYGLLGSLLDENGNGDSHAKRKIHTWRANTASLLAEAMSLDEATSNRDYQHLMRKWSGHIIHLLEPIRLSSHQNYQQGLLDIISQSMRLDREISKQVASIEWSFPEEPPRVFVPNTMELDPGQEQTSDTGVVTLVLGPGLVKHGKSSGDRFDLTVELLKTQVFCDNFPGDINDNVETLESQERRGRVSEIKERVQAYFTRWIEAKLATE